MPTVTNGKRLKLPESAYGLLADMRRTLDGADSLDILIYGNPDPDAIASSVALKQVLKADIKNIRIGYTGAVGRPENASMIRQLKVPAFPVTEKDVKESDAVALVDCQPQFFGEFTLPRCDVVIDHHPNHLDRAVPFVDIRSNYMAASSMLTEYMRAAKSTLTSRIASALYYGIKIDSRHFMNDLSPYDVEAIRWLRGKADREIVKLIEFSQFSREALDYFSIALVKRRFVKGVMFSHLGPVPFSDVCVQVADFLIRVERVEWALVTGVVGETLVVVFRNDGLKKDAGTLARSAFGKIGSAGGHKSMGRAEIPSKNLPEGLLVTDNAGIERFVLGTLAGIDKAFAYISRPTGNR
jgi:nanoRNase/pAp phosphatase (c-di-AMP/oligoRNAs hydrolase)